MDNLLGSNNISAVNSNSNIVLVPIVPIPGVPNAVAQTNIRDVCNYLQPSLGPQELHPGTTCPYDHIIDMMRGLDLQDDGIVMNHKIKSIETDFCNIVRSEEMLSECMEYLNNMALSDGDTSLKFALLFSSRNFDALAMNDTKVRCAMLKILETNFLNADVYRMKNKDILYNSITMLGEYYHRVRLADSSPITILGESLLNLLIREVSEPNTIIEVKLAKLILSQITLNGDIIRVRHKTELTQLLFHIRRNLIEQPALKPTVKALLLMSLDLYYSNFANLGVQLEEMYRKYLIQDDEEEGNNNLLQEAIVHPQPQIYHQQEQLQHQQQHPLTHQQLQILEKQQGQEIATAQEDGHDNSYEGVNGICANDSYEVTKKWSEQVSEESFNKHEYDGGEFNREADLSSGGGNVSDSGIGTTEDKQNNSYEEQRDVCLSSSSRYENEGNHSRRSYNKQRNSPRPLKQHNNANNNTECHPQAGEERDQTQPLPRWRTTRFNRENSDHYQNNRSHQRRFGSNFDDNHQNVRSDNSGSIRLYSINDRLKHSQEKIDRNNYNSIANSNWDRQSQRDDRSERSYMSNYERGNHPRRGGRQYNNRQMYDKPPRFQKNQHQQQHHQQQNKDGGDQIKGDSWRHSTSSYYDENSSYPSNGPESNSRSSSRARTLPRPGKSKFETSQSSSSYHRKPSQSPTHFRGSQYNRNGGNANRGRNSRYSSQGSLISNTSSLATTDHPGHHNRQNRNFERPQDEQRSKQQRQQSSSEDWEDTHSVHGQPEEESWNCKDNNNELVRNARNTTKYMNYLSSKK